MGGSMPKQRVRIYTWIGPKTFLAVENDLQETGKLRWFAGNHGATNMFHFLDVATAQVLCHDLLGQRQPVRLTDYKGYTKDGFHYSNILKVNQTTGDKPTVFIEFSLMPGERKGQGVYMPKSGAKPIVNVNISLNIQAAREMAITVLSHLQAYETARMLAHLGNLPGTFPPYEMSPLTGSGVLSLDPYCYGDGTPAPKDARTRLALTKFFEAHSRAPQDGSEIEVWWGENRQRFTADLEALTNNGK